MATKSPAKSPVKKPVKSAVKTAVKNTVPTPAKTEASKPDAAVAGKNAAVKAKAKAGEQAKEKVRKPKLVRDSFTMPEDEYRVLSDVKKACIKAGFDVKKSELLRVGVALIRNMELPALKNVLATLPPLKAGRPKQDK